jgi:ABC-type transport system substrate-binding protein
VLAVVVASLFASTPAMARVRAARTVVVAAEHDVNGFNPGLTCCNEGWAAWMGEEEALRGAFVQQPNGRWTTDLVSAAAATRTGVSYTIKANANWYWGGRKVPVTYKDFVYTLRQIDNPADALVDRVGYANLDSAHFAHRGAKQVSFSWKRSNCTADAPCGPYGNWQSLFSTLYPSFALRGMSFDGIWTSCICGSDGKPVADGPYYLASYTHGQGSVLKANPYWGGRRPAVREIDFRIIPDRNAEIGAMQSGAVEAIWPAFGLDLESLKNMKGTTFDEVPGYSVERLDFSEGKGASNALLRAPYMRLAIAMGIDRQAIIESVYGDLANGAPLDSALYYATESGYRPDFRRWNYNPKKALALLARHCSGGPRAVDPANTAFWQCAGLPAAFNWSWPSGDTAAALTEAEAKAELRSIGIQVNDQPLPASTFFGQGGVGSGAYDIAEFADVTSGDPGEWADTYRCSGAVNFTGFCSRKVDSLLAAGARQTNLDKRTSDYRRADAALSNDMPALPLYQRPDVLVHDTALQGIVANPGPGGPFWNVEDWRWKR